MTDQPELEQVTTTDLVQAAFITALQGKTAAGYRIYAPRDWPTWEGEYPVLIVLTPAETKDREGLGALGFDVRSTIRVVARVSAVGAEDDEGAFVALSGLQAMQREIETNVIGHPAVVAIANIVQVRSTQGTRATGKRHLGELVMDFDCTFNQGPEAFWMPPTVPLETVRVHVDSGNVVDRDGTYPPPPIPYNVPDAPRDVGPDGRDEAGFETTNLQS